MMESSSIILKKDEKWFVIPCFGSEDEIIRSIIMEDRPLKEDMDAIAILGKAELLDYVRLLGWEVSVSANFAA